MDTPQLIAFLIGAIVFTIYLAMDVSLSRKQRLEQLRNQTSLPDDYYTPEGEDELVDLSDEPSPTARSLENILQTLGLDVAGAKRQMRPDLQHAGINSPDAPIYLLLYRRFFGFLVALIGFSFFFTKEEGAMQFAYWILGLIFVAIGLFGAQLYIKNSIMKRQTALTRAFPDTLDLLVVCVESGLALDAALNRVCGELGRAYPEITTELNRTRLELALLNDRSRALMNLAERTDLVPFRSLVAALIQTEKFGTSLTDTLRVLSDDYRHTRLMVAENKAGRLPALMTIPLITLLLPALFLIVLGPPFIRIQQQGGLFGSAGNS